ncbi:hypothetical protein F5X68DRAFT_245931 [Plectosphaerella plurivora]|uniref:Uncharacterized protein n=1 Tax=Plectosphaerella plurivora TaxID=936078 RepID=A0A9P8V5C6_9PEZI|nr:hypothetical protein F5X68DRAFT_245931 [Plectosphaerella plurivora]
MRSSTSSLLVVLLGSSAASCMPQAASAPNCSHNNCLRAVIAGSFPQRPTRADCSSFLQKTVTPAAYTETIWETITPATATATSTSVETATLRPTETVVQTVDVTQTVVTTVTGAPVLKRQVTVHPSVLPTYATACRSVEAYSSACSCIGISPTTITVATPTVKVTSTSTVTAQTTVGVVETATVTIPATETGTATRTVTAVNTVVVQPAPWETFVIRASGGRVNNLYAYSWQFDESRAQLVQSFASREAATKFSLTSPNSGAHWTEQNAQLGRLTVGRGLGPFGAIWNADAAWTAQDNLIPLSCSLTPGNWELKCTLDGQSDFFFCDAWLGPVLQLGGVPQPSWNCDPVRLYAEYP